jgi:hypothetical protein
LAPPPVDAVAAPAVTLIDREMMTWQRLPIPFGYRWRWHVPVSRLGGTPRKSFAPDA